MIFGGVNGRNDHDQYIVIPTSDKYADIMNLVSHLEVTNVASTPFDFYVQYAKSWTKERGLLKIFAYNTNYPGGLPSEAYPPGTEVDSVGINGKSDSQGNRILMGGRYEFPQSLYFGGEYQHGGKKSLSPAYYSDFPGRPYIVNGTLYHLFLTKFLYKKDVNLRAGYFNIKETTTSSDFTRQPSDTNYQMFYLGFGFMI
jgi:hypothetical protein